MTKDYLRIAFLLYCIFSIFSAAVGGKGSAAVFAQQLSPRYIRMDRIVTYHNISADTIVTFEAAVATGTRGEMVGLANGVCKIGGPPGKFDPNDHSDYIPYIYRLDSTGKFIFLKSIKFPPNGISKYHFFNKIIPYKGDLFIIGNVDDNDPDVSQDCHTSNKFIIKTDSAGTVIWKNKLGYYSGCEVMTEQIICSDGGLLVSGTANLGTNYDGSNAYDKNATFVTKYKADGTIKFNTAFRRPNSSAIPDSSSGTFAFNAIVETPDKGYLLVGGGPYLVKLDANGNKLWEKMPLFDPANYFHKAFGVQYGDIIPYPSGGYVIVGHAFITQLDSTMPGGENIKRSGGFMMKISESGDVEWTKVFRLDYKVIPSNGFELRAQEIAFFDITLSYANGVPVGFILLGNSPGDMPGSSYDKQTVIVKTDLNGNLIWNRQYYTGLLPNIKLDDPKIYEEPGGSILVNSFASPEPDIIVYPPPQKGILRLNAKGYLGDAICSLSPKVAVLDESPPYKYDTNPSVFVTTPPLTGSLSPAGTYNKKVPLTTTSTCVNPLSADFIYTSSCSDSGLIVHFYNQTTGASYFSFNFGDAASGNKNVSDSASCQHLYKNTGTYTVTLTVWDTDSTKTDINSHTIETKTKRYIKLLSANTTICSGTSVNLTATINSGSFAPECIGYRYYVKLDGNNFFSDPDPYTSFTNDSTIFNSKPLNTSLRLFVSTNGNTCIASDTIVVSVLPSVHVSVRGENTTYCKGDSALLIASGSNTYLWNPGGSSNDSLKVYPESTSSYTVSSGKTKVCGTDSGIIKVTVNLIPLVDAGADQTIYPGKQAPLLASAGGGGGTTYSWTPALGLSATNIANPTAEPEQTTTYIVKGMDANSCVSSDSVTVNLKFCGVDLFVPNAFSPNGDNQNDVFFVKTLNNNCIQTFTFKIFDRWGNKVFESEDINNGWDGTFRSKAMDSGVFVYFLNAVLEGGEIVTQKGNITLIR